MTPDLLAALRETPGCGRDPVFTATHVLAVEHAEDCDPCLTRLAEAVLNHYGPTIMEMARDAVMSVMSGSSDGSVVFRVTHAYPDWPSLLTALRSETPR